MLSAGGGGGGGGGSEQVGFFLLRVYKESVQRMPCELNSLSSLAAFIIQCVGTQRSVMLWIGSGCSPADRTLAERLSLETAVEDLGTPAPDCMVEDRENASILDAVLNALWVQLDDYRRTARVRAATPICNKPSFLYTVVKDPVKIPASFNISLLRSEVPDPSSGVVAKFTYPMTADRNSIFVVAVGDQYDLWFGDGVNGVDQVLVKNSLRAFAVEKAPEKRRGIESVMFSRNLRTVSALDRCVFRTHFTLDSAKRMIFAPFYGGGTSTSGGTSPASVHRHRSSDARRSGLNKAELPSTTSTSEGCSDCVGVTFLRLLGISGGEPGSARLFWSDMNDSSLWGPSRNPMEVSPEQEMVAIQSKIQRLTQKIEVKILNPPRWGSKLLVLDLDHTLIDFSCRFDFMFEQLKRPHLDRFLSSCYRQQYDIAIWSQTNWKWLELKLTELGMLNRKDYKICFALDKSSMFTVRQNYIKPLQLIWNKFSDRWGPQNTVRGGRGIIMQFPSRAHFHSSSLHRHINNRST